MVPKMKSVKRKSATSAFLRSRVIVAVRGSAAGRTRDPEASEGPTLVLLNASQPSSHSVNGNRAETGMNAFRSSSWCVMESAERRIATLLSLLKPGPGDILLDAAATERLLLGHHALTGDSHPLLSVAKTPFLRLHRQHKQSAHRGASLPLYCIQPMLGALRLPLSPPPSSCCCSSGQRRESAPVLSPNRKTIKEKNEPFI